MWWMLSRMVRGLTRWTVSSTSSLRVIRPMNPFRRPDARAVRLPG
jgi:hypothetical protein